MHRVLLASQMSIWSLRRFARIIRARALLCARASPRRDVGDVIYAVRKLIRGFNNAASERCRQHARVRANECRKRDSLGAIPASARDADHGLALITE